MNKSFHKCTHEDVYTLQEISCKTFRETFADTNSPEELQEFLDKAYDVEKLKEELVNGNSQFYFLYFNGALAGYLKLNEAPSQTEINDKNSLEIQRLYLLREFQGKGLGKELMDKAIELAKAGEKKYVWLGVWEHNEKALAFYKKYGFYKIGSHSFFVGSDEQTDDIMRKDLI